jgi:hypothetical protein
MTDPTLPRTALVSRARLVVTGAAVGFVLGVAMVGLFVVALGDPADAVDTSFALSSLVLGLAVIGWSGSVLAGPGIETIQSYTGRGSNWTERDSRRAMARLIGLGAGGMLGAMLATPFVV